MYVLLELGRLDEAKVLGAQMGRLSNRAQEPFRRAFLIEGVPRCLARLGEWDAAAEVWGRAPLEQAFRADALVGLVHLYLARASNQTSAGLKSLKEIRQNVDLECAIIIPVNNEGITRDLEKELLKLKRKLEKLLPQKSANTTQTRINAPRNVTTEKGARGLAHGREQRGFALLPGRAGTPAMPRRKVVPRSND